MSDAAETATPAANSRIEQEQPGIASAPPETLVASPVESVTPPPVPETPSCWSRLFSNRLRVEYSPGERRNIFLYIGGIMAFKFAFESLGTAIGLLAMEKFPKGSAVTYLAILTSMFNLCQCLSSIAVAQLVKRWTTNILLAVSIWCFGGLGVVMIVMEACTGGTLTQGGSWNPFVLFPIYMAMGGCLGVIEIVRRIIPRDILGEDGIRLKKMDATVHIFYEVAGTSGAFFSAYFVSVMRPSYALLVLPVCFSVAGLLWIQVDRSQMTGWLRDQRKLERVTAMQMQEEQPEATKSVLQSVGHFFKVYLRSVYLGGRIIVSDRKFLWLPLGYTLPLVLHRFIENVLFPTFAKLVLKNGSYSGIFLGGSNFGELVGALVVLLFSLKIATPLPWVRADAFTLSVLWIFPFAQGMVASMGALQFALACIPLMVVLSGGWAAGDVSLAAYIQSQLNNAGSWSSKSEGVPLDRETSPLGAVMAFLYSSYIVIFTITAPLMGRVFDYYNSIGKIDLAFLYVGGIGVAVVCALVIFLATFIPKNSLHWNPPLSPPVADEETEDFSCDSAQTLADGSEENLMEMVFAG